MQILTFILNTISFLLIALDPVKIPAKPIKQSPNEYAHKLLAESEDVEVNWFDNVRLVSKTKKFLLHYDRSLGEGGYESCDGVYSTNGNLISLSCFSEYRSHSMGDRNAHTITKATREFNLAGKMTKVTGNHKVVLTVNNKVTTDRKISSIGDEALSRLTKPILKLDPKVLKLIPQK